MEIMITLHEHAPLLRLNTFGVDAHARYLAEVADDAGLEELRKHPVFRDQRRLVLGGGSNILFTRDFDGLILQNRMQGIRVMGEDDETVTVKAASGENWHSLVMYCLDRNWGASRTCH